MTGRSRTVLLPPPSFERFPRPTTCVVRTVFTHATAKYVPELVENPSRQDYALDPGPVILDLVFTAHLRGARCSATRDPVSLSAWEPFADPPPRPDRIELKPTIREYGGAPHRLNFDAPLLLPISLEADTQAEQSLIEHILPVPTANARSTPKHSLQFSPTQPCTETASLPAPTGRIPS